MQYVVETCVTDGSTSYMLVSESYLEPIAVATAYPLRNRIELTVARTARKPKEDPSKYFPVRRPAKSVLHDLERRALSHLKGQTILVTGCAGRKHPNAIMPARDLYISSRITFTKRLAIEKKIALFILSAEHGLIFGEDLICTYDRKLDRARAAELVDEVARQLRYAKIESVVFFSAGVNAAYRMLLEAACDKAGVDYRSVGHSCMGGAKELPAILDAVTEPTEPGCTLVRPVVTRSLKGQLRLF